MTRLAFLGSPAVAARVLGAVHAAGHEVALVVTAPDRRRGRGGALVATPVKQCALDLGMPVTDRVADVAQSRVELALVVAFGQLISPELLRAVPMVNLHFSLLPRWRGAAPVERAILAGDDTTGVSLMALDEGLDTGPVYAAVETVIGPGETAGELRDRLADLGTELLLERLAGGIAGLGTASPQVGEATYAAKIGREELQLHFERPAIELDRLVRVGRAWTTFRGKRLIVERARASAAPVADIGNEDRPAAGTLVEDGVVCGEGLLELISVRPEGRSVQAFDAWRRGARPEAGARLGA